MTCGQPGWWSWLPQRRMAVASVELLVEEANLAVAIEAQEFNLMRVLSPRIFIDGDQWCVLHGENLQDGVAGFGSSQSSPSMTSTRLGTNRCLMPAPSPRRRNLMDDVRATGLVELAVRCEQATGADFHRDIDISIALDREPDAYTASLDAAMTLVPEGWEWSLHSTDPNASITAPTASCAEIWDGNGRSHESYAATPALALTAAAVRALATQPATGGTMGGEVLVCPECGVPAPQHRVTCKSKPDTSLMAARARAALQNGGK